MEKLNIQYEDNHVIAVVKPAGMLVQGDATGDTSLLEYVKAHIKQVRNKPGNVFLGLLHRIDRPVSGIVLFAKTSKGASRLSEQFRAHTIQKKYTALVHGSIAAQQGTLAHMIVKDKEKNRVSVFDQNQHPQGGKLASLSYKVLKTQGSVSMIDITLGTGRSHQIRAQFAHIGHPLLGDTKYGSSIRLPDRSIALCASQLSFTTATGGKNITINAPIPGAWSTYITSL